MAPLSEVLKEIETTAGDLFESMPSIGQIITKIDPHLTAVDKIVDLAPRLEAVVEQLEQLAGVASSTTTLAEPPAPAEMAAAATPAEASPVQVEAPAVAAAKVEAEPEPAAAETEPEVTIKVPASQAAALGKTPIAVG